MDFPHPPEDYNKKKGLFVIVIERLLINHDYYLHDRASKQNHYLLGDWSMIANNRII